MNAFETIDAAELTILNFLRDRGASLPISEVVNAVWGQHSSEFQADQLKIATLNLISSGRATMTPRWEVRASGEVAEARQEAAATAD